MNEDLLQPGTQKLRPNLAEKEDFEIVSEDVWTSFGEFRANEIKRGVVTLGIERRVPIYLNEYRYLSLTAKQAKDMGRKKAELKIIEESENATVEQLLKKMMQIEELELSHEGRLWRVDDAQSVEAFL
jgi:CYTH domain-containing protein